MELNEKRKAELKQTIESFKTFNSKRFAGWLPLKPIIGAFVVSTDKRFVGFGVRFYETMFDEPEYLGQGLEFLPIQIIS